ncbi:MAG: hypothetical protein NTW21_37980 [Verrucomicrobia bacterium]|nr:hypothetical protein [Verrucomicrobiota bacterium]
MKPAKEWCSITPLSGTWMDFNNDRYANKDLGGGGKMKLRLMVRKDRSEVHVNDRWIFNVGFRDLDADFHPPIGPRQRAASAAPRRKQRSAGFSRRAKDDGHPARMRQWPIRGSYEGQASPRSMQTRRLKPALRTTTPTFNFQPSMLK